jgi:hypothetical protein
LFTRFAILLILRQQQLRRRLQSSHAFVVTDAAYWPRRPEESLLYQVMADELETFLAVQQNNERQVPRFSG